MYVIGAKKRYEPDRTVWGGGLKAKIFETDLNIHAKKQQSLKKKSI